MAASPVSGPMPPILNGVAEESLGVDAGALLQALRQQHGGQDNRYDTFHNKISFMGWIDPTEARREYKKTALGGPQAVLAFQNGCGPL